MDKIYQDICSEYQKTNFSQEKADQMTQDLDKKFNFYSFGDQVQHFRQLDQKSVNEELIKSFKKDLRTDLVIRQTQPLSHPLRIHSF